MENTSIHPDIFSTLSLTSDQKSTDSSLPFFVKYCLSDEKCDETCKTTHFHSPTKDLTALGERGKLLYRPLAQDQRKCSVGIYVFYKPSDADPSPSITSEETVQWAETSYNQLPRMMLVIKGKNWELDAPGGMLERKDQSQPNTSAWDTVWNAAKRELQEETGIDDFSRLEFSCVVDTRGLLCYVFTLLLRNVDEFTRASQKPISADHQLEILGKVIVPLYVPKKTSETVSHKTKVEQYGINNLKRLHPYRKPVLLFLLKKYSILSSEDLSYCQPLLSESSRAETSEDKTHFWIQISNIAREANQRNFGSKTKSFKQN